LARMLLRYTCTRRAGARPRPAMMPRRSSAGAALSSSARAKRPWNSRSDGTACLEDTLCRRSLGDENLQFRQFTVPLDEGGTASDALDRAAVQRPDVVADRAVVTVDQQHAVLENVLHVSREVEFAD